jgi:hypothetical protein
MPYGCLRQWRLNERCYGELTGLSNQMVKQAATKFNAWEGFQWLPPVSSFSRRRQSRRYQKEVSERCALSAVIPGIENGKFSLHRNSQVRVIKVAWIEPFPFGTHRSRADREAADSISSSENAIRGL